MKKLIGYKDKYGGIALEYKKQDLWWGVFYKHGGYEGNRGNVKIDVWICILPCFPIHYWYGER